MYKVFTENKAVSFDCKSEDELKNIFHDHKFIEAAGGIVEHQGKYLFILRHGMWDIPKGKLDKNETPEVAAVREIEEECGLHNPVIISKLTDTFHTYEHKGKNVLKKTYWYLLKTTENKLNLTPQTEEGITEVKLFDKNQLHEIKSNTYLSILEVIIALEEKSDH